MQALLEKELGYFQDNQDDLVAKYRGKVLLLHNQTVVGVYDDKLTAYLDAKERFAPGTFMIQECIAGSDAYTVNVATLGIIASDN